MPPPLPSPPGAPPPTGFAPLRHRLFRDRWLASVVSNIGTWMQDTAGTWLMAALTGSPLLIALMQTAASLPALFLAYPAGAIADIFDRRRLLIFWQAWMLVAVAVLAVLTLAGVVSPWTLLIFTFLLNIGNALNNPAWQAIVPELVPRDELADAISLNSAGFNLGRAVGPALGGLLVAAFATAVVGAGVVFFVNALSFVAVIVVLVQWRRTPPFASALPAERLVGSMTAGLRYVRHAPVLRAIMTRAFVFAAFASSAWALLAVVAQQHLHRGAMTYGILNGCLGMGAVIGASLLARMRRRLTPDQLVSAAGVVFATALVMLALVRSEWVLAVWLVAAGFAWTSTTATLNTAIQTSVPPWVHARTLGAYQTMFWGGMALGSATWGFIAEHVSTSTALLIAAAGLLASLGLAPLFRLPPGPLPDLHPFDPHRALPEVALEPNPEDGPVLVTIEYLVKRASQADFTRVIHRMRDVRLRDGAIRWGIFEDTARPERFVETFVVESWIEFLRQRERMTASDRLIRDQVREFHQGTEPPAISFMIYAHLPRDAEHG